MLDIGRASVFACGSAILVKTFAKKNKRFFGFSLVAVISGFSFVVLLTYFLYFYPLCLATLPF